MKKLPKVEVLYFTAAQVGSPDLGTRCNKCRDFIQLTHECVIVDGPNVSPAHGTCALYVHGPSHPHGRPLRLISKESAGYIEGRDVPTYCGRCEYYGGDKFKGPCAIVEGEVEYGGCCNAYEASNYADTNKIT